MSEKQIATGGFLPEPEGGHPFPQLSVHQDGAELRPYVEQAVARAAVVREALSWCQTPYHHQGRIKGAGVDCGMLLAEVYERAGVLPHVEPADYPADWHLHRDGERMRALVTDHARPVDVPLPGDIALFRYGRCISHAAIVIEWPQVIHAYIEAGAVVMDDAVANQDLAERLAGFWSPWGGA